MADDTRNYWHSPARHLPAAVTAVDWTPTSGGLGHRETTGPPKAIGSEPRLRTRVFRRPGPNGPTAKTARGPFPR